MARYEIAPTKTNFLRLKQELAFAEEGYDLLDQKRNILMVELMRIIDTAKRMEAEVEDLLKESFKSLQMSVQTNGRRKVNLISNTVNIKHNISITARKIMGVSLPVVNVTYQDNPPYYSLLGTSFWIDEAIDNFKEVLERIGKLAEVRILLIKLAQEVRKTIRKVNALEKIAIPDYSETIKYIEERLDEVERESFFLMKLIKKRLEK